MKWLINASEHEKISMEKREEHRECGGGRKGKEGKNNV